MGKENKIFTEYMNLLVLVAKYTYARKGTQITPEDIFVCIVDLFHKRKVINSYFLSLGIDLNAILDNYKLIYDIDSVDIFSMSEYNFVLAKKTTQLLEGLEYIKDTKYFMISLFLVLLNHKDIKGFLSRHGLEYIFAIDPKKILDAAYDYKELLQELETLLSISEIIPGNITDEDLQRIVAKDDYADFDMDDDIDLEDEDELVDKEEKKDEVNKLYIDTFGINLVEQAKKGLLEPMVGREKELKQVIYTLLRKTKSNPLLIGEAGVGKTAIIEGLAQKIVDGEVPHKLKNKKIYMLDMGTLVAGTKFRGEFEARLKNIIKEAINPDNNIILFIDEIHTVVGAGNQEGGADAANLFKPYLARGELTVIGATTFDEYKKYIEKDPALTRRFQTIKVDEPSVEDAIKLLEGIKHRFEDFHAVNVEKNAIESAVKLSKRYILDRFLPDKAIDLIDEACSRKSSKTISNEKIKKIDSLNKQIEKIEAKIKKAVEEQDYFKAADYKTEIENIKQQIRALQLSNDTPKELRENITEQDIQNVISEKYNVSNKVLGKSEIEFLKGLKKTLNKEIIGQEHIVDEVINAIIRNKISPLERKGPIASFLFLGASGVGKTYMAQLLAKEFFQDENSLIKINMSEYSQSMSSSKLTGSAPGYVGYEEGGQLTEMVRKKPYSVVLFDEIEKGSSEVLNILLQIFDQGYLEDNKGRKIDFKNTIIILTSNLGAEYFNKEVTKVGFSHMQNNDTEITDEKKEMILQEVKNILPIELINRFDKILYFNTINKKTLTDIFKKYFKDYKKLWKEKKGINIDNIKKAELDKILDKIHKEGAGVRGVEKYIYNELENKIIEKILK